MSDGNFNRSLLPKTELASGLRAGRAQMRTKAEQAFVAVMNELFAHVPAEQRDEAHRRFMLLLRQ